MKFTTQQATRRGPSLLPLTAKPLIWGLVAAAGLWLAATSAAPAQELAQSSDRSGANGTPQQQHSLDPWNIEIRSAPKWDPRQAPPQLQPRARRHVEFLQAGVPVEYRSQRNPYPNVGKAIDAGREVYRANCIACHGPRGRGDGDAGLDLVPSPALLTELTKDQGAADEYLMWTISEGGKPFNTAMPAFKGRIQETQIWQVISYLRAGLPQQ